MKAKWLVGAMLVLALLVSPSVIVSAFGTDELVILDFDTGDKPNNIGGDFGAWDKDPNDETQWCEISFEL